MAILLLCKGDAKSKDLLRQAIMAHYGNSPSGYESLHIHTKGRVKHSIGRFKIWLSLDLDIYFKIPTQFRMDYQISLFKIPIQKRSEAFDGQTGYLKKGDQPTNKTTEQSVINAMFQRLWAYSAMLLMPLNEMYVELEYQDDLTLIATNTQSGLSATIDFHENKQIHQVTVKADGQKEFRLELSSGTELLNNINMVNEIKVWWDNQLAYYLHPTQFELVDDIDEDLFKLE